MKSTNTGIQIISATAADTVLVSGLIAAAFHDLEAARWQIPDEDRRRAIYPAYFADYMGHAFEHGNVEMTADLTAAAVWTMETGEAKLAPAPATGLLASALGEDAEQVHTFDVMLHEREPTGVPFEKLALLGVRPGCQGQGLGSELIAYRLVSLDQRVIPAYLEASNKASRALYLRFGFRDYGEPIKLPRGPLMYPMWREPRGVEPR